MSILIPAVKRDSDEDWQYSSEDDDPVFKLDHIGVLPSAPKGNEMEEDATDPQEGPPPKASDGAVKDTSIKDGSLKTQQIEMIPIPAEIKRPVDAVCRVDLGDWKPPVKSAAEEREILEEQDNVRKRKLLGPFDSEYLKERCQERYENNIQQASTLSSDMRPEHPLVNRVQAMRSLMEEIRVLEGRRRFIRRVHITITIDIILCLPTNHVVHTWCGSIAAEVGRMHHAAISTLIHKYMSLTLDASLCDSLSTPELGGKPSTVFIPRRGFNPLRGQSLEELRVDDNMEFQEIYRDLLPVCEWIRKPALLNFLNTTLHY